MSSRKDANSSAISRIFISEDLDKMPNDTIAKMMRESTERLINRHHYLNKKIRELPRGYKCEFPYVKVCYDYTKDKKNLVVIKESALGCAQTYIPLKVFDINSEKKAKDFCRKTIEKIVKGKDDALSGLL